MLGHNGISREQLNTFVDARSGIRAEIQLMHKARATILEFAHNIAPDGFQAGMNRLEQSQAVLVNAEAAVSAICRSGNNTGGNTTGGQVRGRHGGSSGLPDVLGQERQRQIQRTSNYASGSSGG